MATDPFTPVTLNPGAGGPKVEALAQADGDAMPVSALAVSPDGMVDYAPVTASNPLPVTDAGAANAQEQIRQSLATIVDALTNTVLQVAARLAGQQPGFPDTNNVLPVQGVSGGTPMTVALSATKVQGLEAVGSAPAYSPLFSAYIGSDSLTRYPTFNPVAGGGFGGPTVYANVVTDLEGFRSDFEGVTTIGTSATQSLTGTCTFTNGSSIVTGIGTSFASQLPTADTYVRLSTDPAGAFQKLLIQPFYANPTGGSNTSLTLAAPYTGAGGTGLGVFTYWARTVGAGGAIVEGTAPASTSQLGLLTGTTSGSYTFLQHGTHLIAPCNMTVYAWVSQAIANQEFAIGLVDNIAAPGTQTLLIFNGTDPTQVRLRTSSAGGLVETNAGTLPGGLIWTTAGAVRYRMVASEDAVVLFANDIPIVRNKLHLPSFYQPQPLTIAAYNTGAPASTSTLFVDVIGITSHDKVEVEMATTPQPAPVQISGYDASGSLQQPSVVAPSTAATSASSSVVTALSPSTPLPSGSNQLGSVISFTPNLERLLIAIGAKLDAILWVLSETSGKSPPSSDPAYVPIN